MSYERLASEIIVGERSASDAMAELRQRFPNLHSLRTAVAALRARLIEKNIFDERYAATMNAWGDSVDSDDRRRQLVAFAARPLKEQLLLQKRCGRYDPTVFTDVRDACFLVGLRIAPAYLDEIKLTPQEIDDIKRLRDEPAPPRTVEVAVSGILEWARQQLLKHQDRDSLVIAMAVVTGRRLVELIGTRGSFVTERNDSTVLFTGQSNAGLYEKESYVIPVLAPGRDVVAAHTKLLGEFGRLDSATVNNSHSARLNAFVKRRIHPDLKFGHLRVLYVLASFEAFRPHSYSIDDWTRNALGVSTVTSDSYSHVRIVDAAALRGYATRSLAAAARGRA